MKSEQGVNKQRMP